MTRFVTAASVATALLVAGCGGGSNTPVEGNTTPPVVAPAQTTSQTTATVAPGPSAATTTPGQSAAPAPTNGDATAQSAALRACLTTAKDTSPYKWFQPTIDYARSLGGDGFAVTLAKKPVILITFPSAEAAQLGYKDIADRLIVLQQKRPSDYASVAATAAQAIGRVVEVATQGPLDATATATVNGCISKSVT
jgi:hypothetical protein